MDSKKSSLISGLVDFALTNRFMVLALTLLLLVWGAVSFHNLPVEAIRTSRTTMCR